MPSSNDRKDHGEAAGDLVRDEHEFPASLGRTLVLAIVLVAMLMIGISAFGNSGAGQSGRISDVPRSSVEQAHDADWAVRTAKLWAVEDYRACEEFEGTLISYTRCLHERRMARVLYMLRRSCIGANALADRCGLEEVSL